MHRRSLCLALAGLGLVGLAAPAFAQASFPTQPVRMYVGNVAGSSSDTLARVFANAMSPLLGQQVLVINHAGAGGTIAAELVARSAPDGHTLYVTSTQAHAISPHLFTKIKYHPMDDFVPVTMIARTENVLVVPPAQPFRTVKDIVDFAKKNPGKLTMANAGPGSQSHLAGTMFAHMAGIEVLHVPYKGAASVTAVVGNQNELTLTPMPATAVHIASGKLIAIAVGGSQRAAALPNVPTIAESGIKGFESSGWAGLIAPKATPPAVVAKIRDTVIKALQDKQVKEAVERSGGDGWTTTPDAMWKFIAEELERYKVVVKLADLKAE